MEHYNVTDETLKERVSAAMQQHLQELSVQLGHPLRDQDCVDYIAKQTGVNYPITTWQQYRTGKRLRLPFMLLMSSLFKTSLASFLGTGVAKRDYAMAAANFGFPILHYGNTDIALVIPQDLAATMHLKPDTARGIRVTKANNASPNLRLGSLAIIDTSFNIPTLSGDYLIKKDNQAIFAAITATASDSGFKVQFGDTIEQMDKDDNKLVIIGRVVDTLG